MKGLRRGILVLRFACDLAMLAGLAYWGFTGGEGATAWLLGIGAPLASALVWGRFVSKRSTRRALLPIRLSIEVGLFIIAAIALWTVGAQGSALQLAALGIPTSILNAVSGNEGLRG